VYVTVITGVLSAWVAWSFCAHIDLYAATGTARLEVDHAVYTIQSPFLGRVTRSSVAVGRIVKAGDILVELDSSNEALQLNEERARLASIQPQIAAVQREIAAEQAALIAESHADMAALDEAHADYRQAEAPAQYNVAEETRLTELHSEGLIPDRDYQRGVVEAQQARFRAQGEKIAIDRIEREQQTRAGDRQTRIRNLQFGVTQLEGQALASSAEVARLENEIDERIIRAPVSGRLGEAAPLRSGSVLDKGDRIGTILPDGRLIVVAQFGCSTVFPAALT
jgi:multidrug resistance efflux pump